MFQRGGSTANQYIYNNHLLVELRSQVRENFQI